MDGVEWTEDSVCVFDGLENVRERCAIWYAERLSEERAQDILREDEKERHHMQNDSGSVDKSSELHTKDPDDYRAPTSEMPDGVDFFIADPIVERKSVFIGRACRITDPSQVFGTPNAHYARSMVFDTGHIRYRYLASLFTSCLIAG